MIVYEEHYLGELDAYGYYMRGAAGIDWDGASVAGIWPVDAIVWGLLLVVPDSYHAVKVTFAYAGFVGVYLLWHAARRLWPEHRFASLVVLACVPSILFWSAILGKDPLVLLGVGLICLGAVGLAQRQWSAIATFLFGVALTVLIRPWIAALMVVPMLAVATLRHMGTPTVGAFRYRVRWFVGLTVATAFAGSWFLQGTAALQWIVAWLDYQSRSWAYGGSAQSPPSFDSIWDAVAFLPVGVFTAWFRPLPFEVPSLFGLMAGLESLALLALAGWTAVRFRRDRVIEPAVLSGLWFLALWSVLYAFLSYQNLGTGARFRMQALPVALLVIGRLLAIPSAREPPPPPGP